MRLFASFILVVSSLFIISLGGCQKTETISTGNEVALSETDAIEESSATLWVLGMGCPQCSNNVDEQLAETNRPTRQQLAQAITDSGFTLRKIEVP